jgi:hypothetical protein
MNKFCGYCGVPYSRPPSLIGSYCSKACAYAARRKDQTAFRRMRYLPSHPLASKGGLVSESRVILFERLGWGPHPCHWCGKQVDWVVGARGNESEALVADHLNHDPLDDRPENIHASCGLCNGQRTRARVLDDEPHIQRANGSRVRAVAIHCQMCGAQFMAIPAQIRVGRARFCSRSCARRFSIRTRP